MAMNLAELRNAALGRLYEQGDMLALSCYGWDLEQHPTLDCLIARCTNPKTKISGQELIDWECVSRGDDAAIDRIADAWRRSLRILQHKQLEAIQIDSIAAFKEFDHAIAAKAAEMAEDTQQGGIPALFDQLVKRAGYARGTLAPPSLGFARFKLLDSPPEPTDRVIHDPDCPRDCFYRLEADGVIYRIESPLPPVPVDPLDVEYDSVTLRVLLERDEAWRQERPVIAINDIQRAAISAHWSAELRKRVEANKQKERSQVTVQNEDE